MARDTNFTKAVKELLGNEPSGGAQSGAQAGPAAGEEYGSHAAAPENRESAPDYSYTAPPPAKAFPDMSPEFGDVTYITKDTIVTGSIQSKSHVRMEGQMTGDVASEKDVRITGKVDGNVDGDNIWLTDGAVIGDLNGRADVEVDSTAVVIGNVSSENFEADGRIKGSLRVNNAVSLKSNAIIFGNITSKSLNVQDGAVLRGNVQITSSRSNDEDLFTISRKQPSVGEIEAE